MLRARLEYLKDVVDIFVVVECATDHSNRSYTSNFDLELLKEYNIRYTRLESHETPHGVSNWPRVWAHRNGILKGIDGICRYSLKPGQFIDQIPNETLVLISDLDEFPRRELLASVKAAYRTLESGIATQQDFERLSKENQLLPIVYQLFHSPDKEPHVAWLLNQMFYYNVGVRTDNVWIGSRLSTAAHVRHVSPEVVRRWPTPIAQIGNAGWHFSYFGGAEAVKRKMEAIAESSWTGQGKFTDIGRIEQVMNSGKDLYDRDGEGWYKAAPPADIPGEVLKYFPHEGPTDSDTPKGLPQIEQNHCIDLSFGMKMPEKVSEKLLARLSRLPSVNGYRDMVAYLPTLANLAEKYGHVTEFGTFNGVSTTGFLVGLMRLRQSILVPDGLQIETVSYLGYDFAKQPDIDELWMIAAESKVPFCFASIDIKALPKPERKGVYFLDSDHTARQVEFELNLVHQAAECIVLHDTVLFGEVGNDGSPGILHALRPFLAAHPEWVVTQDIKEGVGLMVLEKREMATVYELWEKGKDTVRYESTVNGEKVEWEVPVEKAISSLPAAPPESLKVKTASNHVLEFEHWGAKGQEADPPESILDRDWTQKLCRALVDESPGAVERTTHLLAHPANRLRLVEALKEAASTAIGPVAPLIDILIVAHNPGEDLPRLIASIERNTALPYNVFVWDNGSTDGTVEFIKHHPGIHQWTDGQENIGFIIPNNRMYERGDSPFVCLLNTDTEVFPGWDTALHGTWHQMNKPGVVGYRGGMLDESGRGVCGGLGPEVDYIEGWCYFTSREVVDKELGGKVFDDTNLSFAYAEDSETCLRLREKGYEFFAIPKPLVVHKGGVTTRKIAEQSTTIEFGGKPAIRPTEDHSKLLNGFNDNHAYIRSRHAEFLKTGRHFARHPMPDELRNALYVEGANPAPPAGVPAKNASEPPYEGQTGPTSRFSVATNHPVAVDSLDHLHPCGAMRDNTKHSGFVAKVDWWVMAEKREGPCAFLDIGCAGGGLVRQFHDNGWDAVGVEGSDYPKKHGSGEWGAIPGNLFTADATKEFLVGKDGTHLQFDVITSWEMLEHIREEDLPVLFQNITVSLKPDGVFLCSINSDPWPWEGTDLHVTQRPPTWWDAKIASLGFVRDLAFEEYIGGDWPRIGHAQRAFRLNRTPTNAVDSRC